MTDLQLFDSATWWAQCRAHWLASAAGAAPTVYTRRQCLARARKAEKRIVDLSITAELRCEREALGRPSALELKSEPKV